MFSGCWATRTQSLTGTVRVPDFIARRESGICEIIEIKRPDTEVLKDRVRRAKFYAEFESYIQQCAEYSQYFEDEGNRARFEQRHGWKVQRRVRARLVAGSRDGLDPRRVHDLVSERPLLVFETYDDLLERLEHIRRSLSGDEEGMSGMSFHRSGGPNRQPLAGRRIESLQPLAMTRVIVEPEAERDIALT